MADGRAGWPAASTGPARLAAQRRLTQVGLLGGQGSEIWTLRLAGGYLYAGGSGMVRIADVRTPNRPSWVGSVSGGEVFAVFDGHLAVAAFPGLRIFDVADPARPRATAAYPVEGGAGPLLVAGRYAYILDGAGLQVVDLADPAHPTQVGRLAGVSAGPLAVAGRYAYVANDLYGAGTPGLRVIDVADPARPVEVGAYLLPQPRFEPGRTWYEVRQLAVVGERYVYLGYMGNSAKGGVPGDSGIAVLDVADPAHPELASDSSEHGQVYRPFVLADSRLYLLVEDNRIFRLDSPVSSRPGSHASSASARRRCARRCARSSSSA